MKGKKCEGITQYFYMNKPKQCDNNAKYDYKGLKLCKVHLNIAAFNIETQKDSSGLIPVKGEVQIK